MNELNNIEMSRFTSFKAGGKAKRLVLVDTIDELKDVVEKAEGGYLLLGNGTNTLFAADEFEPTVVKLGEGFDYVEIEEGGVIKAGGSALLSRVSKAAASKSLTGLEFAAGIPGSVGGGVFMNAGAYEGEIKNVLKEVKVLTKELRVENLSVEELDLSYRHSSLMESGGIVLEATFKLEPGDSETIMATMKDFAERRSSKQPLEYPSAGSFFKRPKGHFAGKLIEDAGLGGYSVGGAQVSEKHCGFIINTGDATPSDILNLMKDVQNKVLEDTGILLEPEVRIIK